MESKFWQAKKALESILDREWSLRGSAYDEYFKKLKDRYLDLSDEEICELTNADKDTYFLRKELPEKILRGNHQIVLFLGNGYVGKTRIQNETNTHYVNTSFVAYEPQLEETIDILKELGFDVPEHHYVGIEQTSEGFKVNNYYDFSFVIAADLTDGEKYLIEEVRDRHFETLTNGAELKKQLIDASKILQGIYDENNLSYGMSVNDHVTNENPQEAFRHMFFTQIDPNTNTGKLVLGDLDHVILYRKP